MSVLNQSGEEQVECPLCMEALEVDDLNFYPCSCGYQICRFCWHRIRTDENGLCPACRKAYAENPADFIPLTKEQVAQLKVEKRQREQQRKAKLSESRKHLSNVRVVQKNLVFVVGLPPRLADAEVLKKHEYFGKFGKIHKVVINQSTTYAGSQGPSASAYVTYMKSDDALRAIQSVNNIVIDGRTIKSSLGTTKYCSHFMKNQTCPKADCMYLHFFGDPKASFTKEQMHAGKHQEYERKLHEILLNKMAIQGNLQQQSDSKQKTKESTKNGTTSTNSKENWPQLSPDGAEKEKSTDKKKENAKENSQKVKTKVKNSENNKKCEKYKIGDVPVDHQVTESEQKAENGVEEIIQSCVKNKDELDKPDNSISRLSSIMDDNSSFFSQNSFQKMTPEVEDENLATDNCLNQTQLLNDSLPNINSSEDWEAAFGFSKLDHMEELAKQRSNVKDTLETFGNGFNRLDMFSSLDNYPSRYETKIQDNIMDVLSHKPTNYQNLQFSDRINGQNSHTELRNHLLNGYSNMNNLEMSKFFTDFCKNGQKEPCSIIPNGLNPTHDGLNQSNGYLHTLADTQNFLLLQQRHIEEQLLNLNLKKQTFNQQLLQNGYRSTNPQMYNGEISQNGQNYNMHNHLYQNGLNVGKIAKSRPEDELDFDPFHETQKGLAELLDSESDYRNHSAGQQTTQLNGVNHPHNHIPPPPPGFVQTSTHMNSFGSKILPFLNMGNSQQQQPQQSQQPPPQQLAQNNWSSNNYNHAQSQKSLNSCNDWKMLDPAIVTSSRNFLLTNGQMREQHFNTSIQQPLVTQQLQNGSYNNYQNYSNYNPQIQQTNYNNFSHINNQQNLNWLGNELNSQIATPPGFRTSNQATKQQEC